MSPVSFHLLNSDRKGTVKGPFVFRRTYLPHFRNYCRAPVPLYDPPPWTDRESSGLSLEGGPFQEVPNHVPTRKRDPKSLVTTKIYHVSVMSGSPKGGTYVPEGRLEGLQGVVTDQCRHTSEIIQLRDSSRVKGIGTEERV